MPKNHPTAMTDAHTLVDYNLLAHWVESDAGEDALATALSQPMTPAEKALADEHDAVLRRALADGQDGSGQGR